MTVKATALTLAALSLLLALAALPAVTWRPGATTWYWGNKPSLNRYHNERLKQDRLSAGSGSSGGRGRDAQVLVQGQNNQFGAEWTYGNDPYPPPG